MSGGYDNAITIWETDAGYKKLSLKVLRFYFVSSLMRSCKVCAPLKALYLLLHSILAHPFQIQAAKHTEFV